MQLTTPEENTRFWSSVFDGFEFEAIESFAESTVCIIVPDVPHGLQFTAYYHPDERKVGCYLRYCKGDESARRIFEILEDSIEELADEAGMQAWVVGTFTNSRLGYECETEAMPHYGEDETKGFLEAVRWMRMHIDKLVRTLRPRIQKILRSSPEIQ